MYEKIKERKREKKKECMKKLDREREREKVTLFFVPRHIVRGYSKAIECPKS